MLKLAFARTLRRFCVPVRAFHSLSNSNCGAHPRSSIWLSHSLSTSLAPQPFATPARHFSQVGAPLRKKVTTLDIVGRKLKKNTLNNTQTSTKSVKKITPISMVTAYTYPSAVHVDSASIDILLVGDSLAMVELGHDSTLPVTIDQMIEHCQAVTRGADRALIVADLPFGSYEVSPQQALQTGIRFLKEAGVDCVKLEGGKSYAPHVKQLVQGGVAVMGHIGLTPQRISVLGGFRAQGKSKQAAEQLLEDALALQEAGCFAIVIECVPAEVAQLITEVIDIPTIGIGAGPHTDGQVLVYHDLLGMFQHAHHAKVTPSFCKKYANIGEQIQKALNEYRNDVSEGNFPGPNGEYSPYKLNESEKPKFSEWAAQVRSKYQSGPFQNSTSPTEKDETIKVY